VCGVWCVCALCVCVCGVCMCVCVCVCVCVVDVNFHFFLPVKYRGVSRSFGDCQVVPGREVLHQKGKDTVITISEIRSQYDVLQ